MSFLCCLSFSTVCLNTEQKNNKGSRQPIFVMCVMGDFSLHYLLILCFKSIFCLISFLNVFFFPFFFFYTSLYRMFECLNCLLEMKSPNSYSLHCFEKDCHAAVRSVVLLVPLLYTVTNLSELWRLWTLFPNVLTSLDLTGSEISGLKIWEGFKEVCCSSN